MDKYVRNTVDFVLEVQDASNSAGVRVSDYKTISSNMETVLIPLSALRELGINLSALQSIAFIFSEYSSGTLYYDDIRFVDINSADELKVDDFEDGLVNHNLLWLWTSDGGSCALSTDVNGLHRLIWNDVNDYWYTVIGTPEIPLNVSLYTHISFRVGKLAWEMPRLIESYISTNTFNNNYSANVRDSALAVTALLASLLSAK
jgi:hypothetical protein